MQELRQDQPTTILHPAWPCQLLLMLSFDKDSNVRRHVQMLTDIAWEDNLYVMAFDPDCLAGSITTRHWSAVARTSRLSQLCSSTGSPQLGGHSHCLITLALGRQIAG